MNPSSTYDSRTVGRERMAMRWAVVLLLLAGCLPAAAQTNRAEHFAINIGAPVWQSSVTFTEPVAADLEALGVRWIRMEFIHDTGGDYIDYVDYDEIVDRANAHGLGVLGLIDYSSKAFASSADWANDAWQDSFRDRAVEIVNHYRAFPSGPIRFWEIWNEPDSMGSISAAKFGRLLAITYPAIKAADPHATVISGGLTGYYSPASTYLRDTYNSSSFSSYKSTHGIYPFDILGLHPYHWTADPDTYLAGGLNSTWGVRWRMNHYGDHYKRIWFTEYGWNTSGTAPSSINPGGSQSTNEALQATYLDHAYAIAQPLTYPSAPEYGPYVEKTFLFCYKDFHIGTEEWFGVVDAGGARKPSYFTYQGLAVPALQNAALAAAVSASGEVTPNETADRACDGTPFTKWASTSAVDNHTLTLDLQRRYLVHEVRVIHAEMGHEPDYLNTEGFSIQSSPDGLDPWTMESSVTNTNREPLNILTFAEPKELRYVRLHVTNASYADGWARIPEFEVWGVPIEDPPPPPNPADLDGDGDADLADFAVFARCYTSEAEPPDGCAVLPDAEFAWESAAAVEGLSQVISADDVLAGMIGVAESGGFHTATPGGTAGGLADLTDGVKGVQEEAVLADYLNPALAVRYDFAPPADLSHIHVFAANETDPGNGRVFQHYDVEYRAVGDAAYRVLAAGVTTGPFGVSNAWPAGDPLYRGATLTQVFDPAGGPIAVDVASLRLVFRPVANIEGTFLNVPSAYVSSIIKEIDVFEAGPGQLPANRADLNGDGSVDLADYAVFESHLSGPPVVEP